MSNTCGNCDCADKTQCDKKGNSYTFDIVETQESYKEAMIMDVSAGENDANCKCKCGSTCSCVNCTCCDN
ncbi:Metallothionein-like protein 3 [Cardamine amara subsp. amara]|uniref:Metallothionein-like protein 3 n=1 Tax=Cardamine amara subsp. amara TaxID=228776 RepID=A0ABD1ALV6_CARAN